MQTLTNVSTLKKSTVNFIRSLSSTKNRNIYQRFLVEGTKCCYELLNSDYQIDYFVVDADRASPYYLYTKNIFDLAQKRNIPIYSAKSSVFYSLCDTQHPQTIIAIAHQKQFKLLPNQSFIGLDNVIDPGNVGTIIRICEWFGIQQILFIGECVNFYSPKVIRAAMGSAFRMRMTHHNNIIDLIPKYFNDIPIYVATPVASTPIFSLNPSSSFGLIVGNESRGVSAPLQELDNSYYFNIPGKGDAESLNVGVAVGIALYELVIKR